VTEITERVITSQASRPWPLRYVSALVCGEASKSSHHDRFAPSWPNPWVRSPSLTIPSSWRSPETTGTALICRSRRSFAISVTGVFGATATTLVVITS
jgi:hypothetical protein